MGMEETHHLSDNNVGIWLDSTWNLKFSQNWVDDWDRKPPIVRGKIQDVMYYFPKKTKSNEFPDFL